MISSYNTAELNEYLGQILAESLALAKVKHIIISPGARSTPITMGMAQHNDLQKHIIIDERAAAYFALGIGKASRQLACIVSTSGTALANYFPAIIEAKQSQTPLFILTADRPPELHHVGANQTISQKNIYGDFVKYHITLTPPTSHLSPEGIQQIIMNLLETAHEEPCGPVHLNVQLREPLVSPVSKRYPMHLLPIKTSKKDIALSKLSIAQIRHGFKKSMGIIIAGRGLSNVETRLVLELSSRTGWLILPDVLSGLRTTKHSNIIHYYDLILKLNSKIELTNIIHFGGPFVSKVLLQKIENSTIQRYIHIHPMEEKQDPTGQVTLRIQANIEALLHELLAGNMDTEALQTSEETFQSQWIDMNKTLNEKLDSHLLLNEELTEPAIARQVSTMMHPDHILFSANSMPIRDLDSFANSRSNPIVIYGNRGVSGIDGNIATALGISTAQQKPITLLIGDLTVLHDLHSLTYLKKHPYPISIILINNSGGGIFSFLPVAQRDDVFDPYFSTPHDFDFTKLSRFLDVPVVDIQSLHEFKEKYSRTAHTETIIYHIRTNRDANIDVHKAILSSLREF